MVNAIKLALQDAGGKAGTLSVTYVSLDSSTAQEGAWTSERVLDNARQAVRDINAIAYIGDRDSEATALSLPLTNEGNILQVSPTSAYDGLTRPGGVRTGEPERFYPARKLTFGRMVRARSRAGVGARRLHEGRGRAHARDARRSQPRRRRDRRPGDRGSQAPGHHGHRQGPHRRDEGRPQGSRRRHRRDGRRRVPVRRPRRHRRGADLPGRGRRDDADAAVRAVDGRRPGGPARARPRPSSSACGSRRRRCRRGCCRRPRARSG